MIDLKPRSNAGFCYNGKNTAKIYVSLLSRGLRKILMENL